MGSTVNVTNGAEVTADHLTLLLALFSEINKPAEGIYSARLEPSCSQVGLSIHDPPYYAHTSSLTVDRAHAKANSRSNGSDSNKNLILTTL